MVNKLRKSLLEWQTQGLISKEHVIKITAYEETKKRTQWMMMGFMSLGILVLGIGVISIIASNWSEIPDIIKLACNFLVLSVIGFFIHKSSLTKSDITTDLWITLLSILYFASIYYKTGKSRC